MAPSLSSLGRTRREMGMKRADSYCPARSETRLMAETAIATQKATGKDIRWKTPR